MSYLGFLQGEDNTEKHLKKTNYDVYLDKKQSKLTIKNQTKKVEISTPTTFADVEKLIDCLRKKCGIIVDFSSTTRDTQRMVDYLVGAVYALEGRVEQLSHTIYLMTPKGIEIIAKTD